VAAVPQLVAESQPNDSLVVIAEEEGGYIGGDLGRLQLIFHLWHSFNNRRHTTLLVEPWDKTKILDPGCVNAIRQNHPRATLGCRRLLRKYPYFQELLLGLFRFRQLQNLCNRYPWFFSSFPQNSVRQPPMFRWERSLGRWDCVCTCGCGLHRRFQSFWVCDSDDVFGYRTPVFQSAKPKLERNCLN
jgi:hypothetical protein